MRRLLAGAAVGLGLLLAAPVGTSFAASAAYDGSHLTTPTTWTKDGRPPITAEIIRKYNPSLESLTIQTWFTTPSGLPSGCGSAGEVAVAMDPGFPTSGDKANSSESQATASAPCNGNYTFRVRATLKRPLQADDVWDSPAGHIAVAVPADNVSKVTGSYADGAVALDWPALSSPPPDFTSYIVQRTSGPSTIELATLNKATTSYTDTAPPPEGGDITYRVYTVRSGPNGPVASSGKAVTVTVPASTTTSTPGTTDGGGTGGTAGTGGSGGTAGTGGTGGTGGTAGTGGTSGTGGAKKPGGPQTNSFPALKGSTGIGTKAPRLGTPSQSALTPDLEGDDGFDEELNYGDQSLADGGEASGDGGLSVIYGEGSGHGLAGPIATGLVLAGWGFHMMFLARSSRPQRGHRGRRHTPQLDLDLDPFS